MTKLTEIKQQKQELNSLVNSANFLNDFQKQNYNLLIDNYYEPAEDLARDYDTSKSHYDRLTDTDPKKSQYKAKMDKSESGLSPYLEALTKLKTEISTMEQILNKITGLETKIDNLKTTTGTTDPNLVKPCPCDITGLDKKIDDLKTAVINKDKRTAVLSIQNNKSMSEYNTREGNKYPVFFQQPRSIFERNKGRT